MARTSPKRSPRQSQQVKKKILRGVRAKKSSARPKGKRAQLPKGKPGKHKKGYIKQKQGNLKSSLRGKKQQVIDNKEIDATGETGRDKKSEMSLITPVLKNTIRVSDEDRQRVHDLVFVKQGFMVVSTWGSVHVVDARKEGRVLNKYQLDGFIDLSRVDDNTVLFFEHRLCSNKAKFARVIPQIKITSKLDFKHRYYTTLRALDKESLIGIRYQEGHFSLEILNMKGNLLKYLRPRILNGMPLKAPEYLCVSTQKNIGLVDGEMCTAMCFPSSGNGGFLYSGDESYEKITEMGIEDFKKKYFIFKEPCTVAFDSTGNFYVANDYKSILAKLDQNGNFIQNMLPLKTDVMSFLSKHLHMCIEEDQLYTFNERDASGRIMVYDISS